MRPMGRLCRLFGHRWRDVSERTNGDGSRIRERRCVRCGAQSLTVWPMGWFPS